MGTYRYKDLKKAAKIVKIEFARKGVLIRKKLRKKPRNPEKLEILYLRALNRLKRYKAKKIKGKIYLSFLKS